MENEHQACRRDIGAIRTARRSMPPSRIFMCRDPINFTSIRMEHPDDPRGAQDIQSQPLAHLALWGGRVVVQGRIMRIRPMNILICQLMPMLHGSGYDGGKVPWKARDKLPAHLFQRRRPGTGTYERYDPLLSGGQNNYVPGNAPEQRSAHANLQTHRVTVRPSGSTAVGLTLEYSLHRANELITGGAIGPMQTLQSKDLAQELGSLFQCLHRKELLPPVYAGCCGPGQRHIKRRSGEVRTNWYALRHPCTGSSDHIGK